jgi:FKBP-type peptidyl-prolyl cis-trans isomerase
MIQFVAPATRVAAGALLVLLTVGGVACTSPTSPTFGAPFTTTDLRVGTGTEAATGKTVLVTYAGWLYDGTKSDKKGQPFDASAAGVPFVVKLGAGQVIQGWDVGIPGMKAGGLRQLIIPSELAYGRDGAGTTIPPNATLVFEIELISVAGG